jgi:uncharacterized protein
MVEQALLEKIVAEWSYWDRPPSPSIRRERLDSIPPLQPDIVTVIQGVRRCGKSTLLAQLMHHFGLDPARCFFVNFEDPRLSDALRSELLDDLLTLAAARCGDAGPRYFFFDEIQNVAEWPRWFHRKAARAKLDHFVVTGSNASLLSGKVASALTGRHITVELFPFSFSEYRQVRPAGSIESFLREGGFPRPLTFSDAPQLLREYFADIVERDVRRNLSLRAPTVLLQLAKAVFESMGSEVSQRKLASVLGISTDTVGEYLDACTSAYLIEPCYFFTFSERQRVVRKRKYYPVDLGLRASVITQAGQDLGKGLEALVFLHLRRKFQRVYYWRKQGEVDLVVQDGSRIIPHQVSWDGEKERHKRAMDEFAAEFPQAQERVMVTRENVGDWLAG